MKTDIRYLAIPYSHKNPRVKEIRFEIANIISAYLMNLGEIIFSPITHSYPLAKHNLPTGWDYWKNQDFAYLTACKSITVVRLNGWLESSGVQDEVKIMKEMGKDFNYFDPYTFVDATLIRLLKEHEELINVK